MTLKGEVIILSELGLHARPASVIARMIRESGCFVEFDYSKESRKAQGDSIISLLALGAGKGEKLHITITGDQGEELLISLQKFFNSEFKVD